MRQMRKKIIIAIIVTLLLTAAVAFTISHFAIKSKDERISELEAQAVDTKCLGFTKDLEADSIITQEDLKEVDIKFVSISSGTYIVEKDTIVHYTTFVDKEGKTRESRIRMKKEDLVGRVVKANVSKNTLLLDSLLYNEGEEPTKDERIQEFNFIQLPSDLNTNDYIDIRIQFPTGEDYSVLIGKKIEKIAGENTIFIKLNEEEIMTMGSAIIEAYMQSGVRLYANKYTDPATQLFDEAIVDYVAKYEYALNKAKEELISKELRREIARLLPANKTVVVSAGEAVDENGNVVTDSRTITVVTETIDGIEYITKDMLDLIPERMKKEAEKNMKDVKVDDIADEVLAKYAGIDKAYIEEIKLASSKNDENILNFYRVMRVTTRESIIRTYPVKDEVLNVIRNNPNLLQTVIKEFDTTALLNTRIDEYKELEKQYNEAYDEYTKQQIKEKMKALVATRTGNVEKNLASEIATQKAERVSYLESLIND